MKEPTRVGSFDDDLYRAMKSVAEDLINNSKRSDPEIDRLIYENIDELIIRDNQVEQRIADSHDITKSNFGLTSWQK